jgi:hypothetical protein
VFFRLVASHSRRHDELGSRNEFEEIAMLFTEIRRLVTWLTQPHVKSASASALSTEETSSAFEFDPMWHGDHWQNLLSSPMDARRYVMEDWSIPALEDWPDADGTARAH